MNNLSIFLTQLIQNDLTFLASKENLNTIDLLTKTLPESDRIAFETSLTADNNLDIHYNIRIANLRIFNTFLENISNNKEFNHPSWEKIKSFLTIWKINKSQYFSGLESIFLEFDTSVKKSIHPPAIFLKIKGKNSNNELIKSLIIQLNSKEYYSANENALKTIQQNLTNSSYIGYIGIMLSRDIPILRININGLKKHEIISFLKKINWNGNIKELDFFINELLPLIDITILSFDVFSNQVLDKIGFEFKITNSQKRDIRFHKTLDILQTRGLITENKAEYLINCNKSWFPSNTEWHPSLVFNSLFHNIKSVDSISYFLSHLKFVITKDGSLVKAYTGICQNFKNDKLEKADKCSLKADRIKNGIKFLLKKNNQSGFWTDYFAFGSVSDQWITGLIGSLLIKIDPLLKTNKIITNSIKALNEKDTFGYNQCTIPDADSTIWVILFNKLVGNKLWKEQYNSLKNIYFKKTGFITYAKDSIQNMDSTWSDVHNCVTASGNLINNEFTLLIKENVFKSKWWISSFYTSSLMAISGYKFKKEDINFINSSITSIEENILQKRDLNIFNIALLLISASSFKNQKKRTLINYLYDNQLSNGSWKGDAEMKLNDSKNTIIIDQNGFVTTSFVLLAIKLN